MNRAAVVGWGTTFHVVHLVQAIRTLHAAGQCHATVPLLRSVMEYALGTMRLADAGEDAVDVLNRRLQGSKLKLRADLELDSISLAHFPAEAFRTFMDTLAAQLPPHPDERLSPASSGTPPPSPPKSSTAANYDPSSPPAPKSWTNSSKKARTPRQPRQPQARTSQPPTPVTPPDSPDGKPRPPSRTRRCHST